MQERRKRFWEAGAATVLTVLVASMLAVYLLHTHRQRMSQALLKAAADGDSTAVKDWLRRGGDPNALQTDRYGGGKGYTPLRWTASNGDVLSLGWLLRHGADPSRPDGDGWTPLMWGHGDYASEEIHLAIVRQLIAAGAEVNARNEWGETALMHAECPPVVRHLLANGADFDARDRNGHSALKHARDRRADSETIRLLQQAGTPE
jgi:uncharacterized protein